MMPMMCTSSPSQIAVNFGFFGAVEELVYQHAVVGQVFENMEYVVLQLRIVDHDAHPFWPPNTYEGRTNTG
jgi:hypothetical protein